MKLIKLLAMLIFTAVIGGFIYLGFVDVPIQQHEVSKNISHETLFDE